MDEVGRGALAGPVVVAAVQIVAEVDGVTDSKQIPKCLHGPLADKLKNACSMVRFGQASNTEIDRLGISVALALAYERALNGLKADLVLTDHYNLPTNHRFIRATKGDSLFYTVAAASIIAKTYRDLLMSTYGRFFPVYSWAKNAGYGTKAHIDAIQQHGQTPLHRQSFNTKRR